mmetsp:Transcript_33758/g.52115  ORF Transcript_33758/g.52115 Transcript_33758/m.52115 type:complete len:114 (+) Transcript_33758:427-768(+)
MLACTDSAPNLEAANSEHQRSFHTKHWGMVDKDVHVSIETQQIGNQAINGAASGGLGMSSSRVMDSQNFMMIKSFLNQNVDKGKELSRLALLREQQPGSEVQIVPLKTADENN